MTPFALTLPVIASTSAHTLITYIHTAGSPVIRQPQRARPVRQSHTVTPISVSAASS